MQLQLQTLDQPNLLYRYLVSAGDQQVSAVDGAPSEKGVRVGPIARPLVTASSPVPYSSVKGVVAAVHAAAFLSNKQQPIMGCTYGNMPMGIGQWPWPWHDSCRAMNTRCY